MALAIFSEERRKWWTLAAVSFGLFMIMLDNTVVNVALPAIQEDLGIGLSELQWIVTGYALTFAALMLIGGKLADAYGRRLIFVVGIVVFTGASLWCGLADSGEMLIAGADRPGRRRGADEPGDAVDHRRDLPAAAARDGDRHLGRRLRARARDRPARRRPAHRAPELALDLLHQRPGRGARDRGQLPVDRRSKDETHESLDLPGLATSALGLFALTYGLIEANSYGWTSADPRLVRDRRRLAGRVHRDRAAPARRCST